MFGWTGTSSFDQNQSNYYPQSLWKVTVHGNADSVGLRYCKSLIELILDGPLESANAFSGSTSLSKIYLSKNATKFSVHSFNASPLMKIEVESENEHFVSDKDQGYTLYTIDKKALLLVPSHNGIINLTIPYGVETISSACYNHQTLQTVEIPDTVKDMRAAFMLCSQLQELSIPPLVTTLGASDVYGCNRIKKLTIHDKVSSIAFGSLEDLTSLESLTIPFVTGITDDAGNTYNYFSALFGATNVLEPYYFASLTGHLTYYVPSTLKEVIIDGQLITQAPLSSNAFYDCKNIETIKILSGVSSIPSDAFTNCNFKEIWLSKEVTVIASGAFRDSTSPAIYCEFSSQPSGWDSGMAGSQAIFYFGVEFLKKEMNVKKLAAGSIQIGDCIITEDTLRKLFALINGQ